jgi:hypothetical protein
MAYVVLVLTRSFGFSFVVASLMGCQKPSHYDHSVNRGPSLASSTMQGLVMTSPDGTHASSALHLYDLQSGESSLFLGGESGDVFTWWDSEKLYVFNRAPGRVSYSHLDPWQGGVSRSQERTIPGGSAFDPVAVARGPDGRLVLSMNSGGRVVVADEPSQMVLDQVSSFSSQDRGQIFRPAEMVVFGDRILVLHQGLDQSYQASGKGRLINIDFLSEAILARNQSGLLNDAGVELHSTNPVYIAPSHEDHLDEFLVAGVCYPHTGPNCSWVFERVSTVEKKSTLLSAIDSKRWEANGGFFKDLGHNSLLSCVIDVVTRRNHLVRFDVNTGEVAELLALDQGLCGGVLADRDSQKILVATSGNSGDGRLLVLDSLLNLVDSVGLPYSIGSMLAVRRPETSR